MKPLILTLLALVCILPAGIALAEADIMLHCDTLKERKGKSTMGAINVFISPNGNKISFDGETYLHKQKSTVRNQWIYIQYSQELNERVQAHTEINPRMLTIRQKYYSDGNIAFTQNGFCMPIKNPFKLFDMLPEE